MSFTIYLKPEAVDEFLKWQEGGTLSDQVFLWMEARLRLVTQPTSGWIPISISVDQWFQITDNFNNFVIFKN
jgi:hypothetical protein